MPKSSANELKNKTLSADRLDVKARDKLWEQVSFKGASKKVDRDGILIPYTVRDQNFSERSVSRAPEYIQAARDGLEKLYQSFGLEGKALTTAVNNALPGVLAEIPAPSRTTVEHHTGKSDGEKITVATFEKPAILATRRKRSSQELDALTSDLELVRAARSLLNKYNNSPGEVRSALSDEEVLKVREARRIVSAYDRRRRPAHAPG